MSTIRDIDLRKVFAPIPGKSPVGQNLQYEKVYDEIRAARTDEDDDLPRGIWKRDLKRSDWSLVESLCIEALENRSKDLQIASWLTEAWLNLHGIKGLGDGIRLSHELASMYWDKIYPQFRDADVEFRLSPLEWLNSKLATKIRLIPITHSALDQSHGFSYTDWETANRIKNLAKMGREGAIALKQASQDGHVTFDKFAKNLTDTPSEFYHELGSEVASTLESIHAFEAFISKKCPGFPGILNHLREELLNIDSFVKMTLKKRGISLTTPQDQIMFEKKPMSPIQIETPKEASKTLPPSPHTGIKTREEAYALLGDIANFLEKIEPHSPTPYLIRRAVSWGHLSLAELLQEIVHDRGDLGRIMHLLGIGNSSPPHQPGQ